MGFAQSPTGQPEHVEPLQEGVPLEDVATVENLTFDQIKARYSPDWVLIGDIVTDENLEVLSGRVLFHSADDGEVYRKARDLMPGRFAVQFLGTTPEHIAINL